MTSATKGPFDDLIDNYASPPDVPEARKAALSTVKQWNTDVQAKDIATLRSLMADGIVIELPFSESGRTDARSYRVYQSIDACLEFWRQAFEAEGQMHAFTEMDLTVNPDGSRIFLEARGHLTMASGRDYRNRYVVRFDVSGGRFGTARNITIQSNRHSPSAGLSQAAS